MRLRYSLTLSLEVPGASLADATERALRLLRPRVRAELRQSVAYVGAYRGAFFVLNRAPAPPAGRVNLKARRRKLRKGGAS